MKRKINGTDYEIHELQVGEMKIEYRDFSPADQWDVAEISPQNPPGSWRAMTLAAVAVTDIDGVPTINSNPLRREDIRRTLNRLGDAGVRAVIEALFPQVGEDEAVAAAEDAEAGHRATVGNSSPTEASVS